MAYEPLHHKYRPQTFSQLVGQTAIATTLSNALQQNRIAPAYLFCGPRGTGKTSSARILAKSINCLKSEGPTPDPCGQCQVCREITVGASLDIVEIDAASNTGVDNIRELIERAQFAPVQCRYKLYVLDEVHMLSTAAFNALLKTLEEPPPHVVFVLATTDPQRVLPTIISRCQRFDFRRIPLDSMVQHLDYIAQQESIAISADALQLVAQLSQGGLRDAESLLDQLGLLAGEISIEAVWDLVGAVSERDLLALVQAIAADDGTQVLVLVRQLMDRGREPLMVLQSLVAFYRDLLIAKTAADRRDLVAITPSIWSEMVTFARDVPLPLLLSSQQHLRSTEVQVKNTTQPRLWLEITLMGLLPSAQPSAPVGAKPVSPPPLSVAAAAPPLPTVAHVPAKTSASANTQAQQQQPQASPSEPVGATPVKPVATPSTDTPLPAVEPSPPPVSSQSAAAQPESLSSAASGSARPESARPESARPESAALESARPESAAPSKIPTADNAPAMGSLDDIWAKIVAQLTPMGTQVLMRQHGQLMACDGVEARVGITNDKLMRMAQDRLSNVETAFEKVFGHRLRVTMVVAAANKEPAPSPSLSAPSSPPAPPQRRPSAPPSPPPPSPPPTSVSSPAPPPVNHSRPVAAAPAASPSAPPPSPSAPPAIDASAAPTWKSETDLDRSVKSFAQFFNGQIVNLDDEAEANPSKTPSSEPGPDVPF
ncbi:DNA polymerase III subunit gamma/tau [Leptothoe kymatousa]|uniref:DNA polymerase III subunit gamma/tau n=1 Tax=Leptothoe kymatousa TAU-MAC 1615 TaxID=2364775 RepID=A0ABS5Y453_9CYAN|nr:DNA polymerase III subunit gamma/tau [Leptothoe kymatousa]MBT9312391.1 DNA polymerase III subunit gamma/tau [Leptothoe kymatousa TAU-MAC 1615]